MNARLYRGTRSYPVPVWSGILEHCKSIGAAIWVFFWCLDKITKEIDGADGRRIGLVLGGKPVPIAEIARDLGKNEKTIRADLDKLEKGGRIRRKRTPHGYTLEVMNSAKWDVWKSRPRSGENARSLPKETGRFDPSDRASVPERSDENTRCRSDSAVDSTEDTTGAAPFGREVGLREPVGGNPQPHSAETPLPVNENQTTPTAAKRGGERGSLTSKLSKIARSKSLICALGPRDAERRHFEEGVFRKKIEAAYIDSLQLGHRRAVREAVSEAALSIASNRAVELRGIAVEEIELAVWERIAPLVSGFEAIQDFDTRVRMMQRAIVRVIAEEAIRLRSMEVA